MPGQLSPLFTWRSAIADSDLPTHAKALAWAIALHMNERGGSAWPAVETLARETSMHPKTVRTQLRRLREDGWLDISTRPGTSSMYRATVPEVYRPDGYTVQHGRPPTAQDGRGSTAQSAGEHVNEHVNEVTPSPTDDLAASIIDAAFDVFWSAYPRHVARPTARTAFGAAIRRASVDEVVAGAVRYRDDPNRVDEFTAHPATWLRRDGWNDDPLPPRGTRRRRETVTDRAYDAITARQSTIIAEFPDGTVVEGAVTNVQRGGDDDATGPNTPRRRSRRELPESAGQPADA